MHARAQVMESGESKEESSHEVVSVFSLSTSWQLWTYHLHSVTLT